VATIWGKILDIATWTSWDRRLEAINIIGSAHAGANYTLKPWLGNEIVVEVLEADENAHYFHDKAQVKFGTIETERSVTAVAGGSLLTQTMLANIDDKYLHAFARSFWPDWAQGLIEATRALALASDLDSGALGAPQPQAAKQEFDELVAAHRN
jgi:hypothetical protein